MKPSYSIFFWLAVFLTLIASCFAFSVLVRFHIILWKSCKLHKLKPDQPRYYFNWPSLFREISTKSQSLFSKKLRATNRQNRNVSVCLYNSTYHSLYSESNQVANVLSNDVSKFFQTSFESSLMITFIEGHFYPFCPEGQWIQRFNDLYDRFSKVLTLHFEHMVDCISFFYFVSSW